MNHFAIKKIDCLLLRKFITTFISLLALVLFVMVIQSFFILLSAIADKGLGIAVYTKLLFYLGLRVFPNAFPIAILITSLLVYGNLSESLELTAMRSVGLSLERTLRFPLLFVLLISGTLFYFQHYIHPGTQHKIFALLEDVFEKKSDLFIQQGVFCTKIPGYSIRVDKKEANGHMEGIVVYDYTQTYGRAVVTAADKGKMYTTADKGCLIMELINGHNYVEDLQTAKSRTDEGNDKPFYRTNFAMQKLVISLEALKLGNSKGEYSFEPQTQNRAQLNTMIVRQKGELRTRVERGHKLLSEQLSEYSHNIPISPTPIATGEQTALLDQIEEDGEAIQEEDFENQYDFLEFRNQLLKSQRNNEVETLSPVDNGIVHDIVEESLQRVQRLTERLTSQQHDESIMQEVLSYTLFEKHNRLVIALRCLIMFLLAAPLGCIIKRGGFGISVMISCFFILLEYILSMLGRDWATVGSTTPLLGAWLANLVLLPFCLLFLANARQGYGFISFAWHNGWSRIKRRTLKN